MTAELDYSVWCEEAEPGRKRWMWEVVAISPTSLGESEVTLAGGIEDTKREAVAAAKKAMREATR